MGLEKFIAGYISGWIALLIELAFFGGAALLGVLGGIFPESASQLSRALENMAIINFFINLFVGITAAFNIGGMRDVAFGFLAGVLTVIIIFGSLLSSGAPQVLNELWVEFFTVLLPIVIVTILAIAIQLYRGEQEYSDRW